MVKRARCERVQKDFRKANGRKLRAARSEMLWLLIVTLLVACVRLFPWIMKFTVRYRVEVTRQF